MVIPPWCQSERKGLLPLDPFNGHFGLEIRGVTNTPISHYPSLIDTVGFPLITLSRYWEHYSFGH